MKPPVTRRESPGSRCYWSSYGRGHRHHALYGSSARRIRIAARPRADDYRSRFAVSTRHPAFLPQVPALSANSRRSGNHAQYPFSATPLFGSAHRQGFSAAARRPIRPAHRLVGSTSGATRRRYRQPWWPELRAESTSPSAKPLRLRSPPIQTTPTPRRPIL